MLPSCPIDMPKISSVMQHAINILLTYDTFCDIFCDKAALIRRYRRFVTRLIATISTYVALAATSVYTPYSPAEARVKKLDMNPNEAFIPAFFAIMPSEKATAKYPNAMGIPSRKPRNASCRVFMLIMLPSSMAIGNDRCRVLQPCVLSEQKP